MDKNTLSLTLSPTLVTASIKDIEKLYNWFTSGDEIRQWGGPNMRFPISLSEFIGATHQEHILSYKLIDEEHSLLAFGQCYQRLGRCHLARLVVNPLFRSRGIGKQLVMQLMVQAAVNDSTSGFSLFVLPSNRKAKKLYESLGFQRIDYPQEMTAEMSKCEYLIKN